MGKVDDRRWCNACQELTPTTKGTDADVCANCGNLK